MQDFVYINQSRLVLFANSLTQIHNPKVNTYNIFVVICGHAQSVGNSSP